MIAQGLVFVMGIVVGVAGTLIVYVISELLDFFRSQH